MKVKLQSSFLAFIIIIICLFDITYWVPDFWWKTLNLWIQDCTKYFMKKFKVKPLRCDECAACKISMWGKYKLIEKLPHVDQKLTLIPSSE